MPSHDRAIRIGILGGTFDPVHYGHLRLGEEARENLHLDEIIFMPCAQPPLKKHPPFAEAEHRYQMVLLAIETNPAFRASRLEIERGGVSYTVDTLRELRSLHPRADLFFIAGLDAVLDLPKWWEAEAVLELCSVVTAVRSGFDPALLKQRLPPHYREHIHLLDMPPIGISGTEIRRRLAQGRSIRYWTPDSVIKYIRENQLYGMVDG